MTTRWPTSTVFRICTKSVVFGGSSVPLLVQYRQASASSKSKVRKLISELPKQALGVDGKPLPSLPPFEPETQPKRRRSRSSSDNGKDKAWEEALTSGEFPDTALAREIWENMSRYPDDLILTRVGMFYESYFTQAPLLSALLQIRLTSKKFTASPSSTSSKSSTSSFPFAGFPISQRDKYFSILLSLGRSVVIVEEKDPHDGRPGGKSKGEAKDRFVARKLTPGTLMVENWSSMDDNRYLMAISMGSSSQDLVGGEDEISRTPVGIAYIDISTDRALITKTSTLGELEHDLARLSPVEVVWVSTMIEKAATDEAKSTLISQIKASGVFLSHLPEEPVHPVHQSLPSLEGRAASIAQKHLENCLMEVMPVLMPPNHQSSSAFMKIDASTLLSLEIRQTIRHEAGSIQGGYHSSAVSRAGTLLSVIKRTLTPSGTRLLVNSLCQPSAYAPTIIARHDLVEAFVTRSSLREDLRERLRNMTLTSAGGGSGITGGSRGDLGRIVQRFLGWKQDSQAAFGSGVGFGRDLWDLKSAIEGMSWVVDRAHVELKRWKGDSSARRRLVAFIDAFRNLDDLARIIDAAVVETALVGAVPEEDVQDSIASEGSVVSSEEIPLSKAAQQAAERDAMWWIKPTASDELDELHELNDALLRRKDDMERDLQSRYNSPKLILRNNNMGYHVHTRTDQSALLSKEPAFFSISSTKSTRAFMYNEWTALGSEIYNMSDRILAAQRRAFEKLRKTVCDREEDLTANASLMSELDLTMGFAQVAGELRLVRPVINDGFSLNIINGRHPTVEHGLSSGLSPRNFVPNSLNLSPTSYLHLITGPNMGGKSTVLRQTAIIAILAQAGCYVPADKAEVGVVDRVFSRVGARDDLFMDRSTFMVEMHETAYILRRATPRSLVIMDEIGRGTTLLSGISIAFATLDHILRHIGCRTLFATHYHELADMLSVEGKPVQGVEFWSTDVDEVDNRFSYSYKLKSGVNRHSHAIKVARQAGMPDSFLQVAKRTLTMLEAGTAPPLETKRLPPS